MSLRDPSEEYRGQRWGPQGERPPVAAISAENASLENMELEATAHHSRARKSIPAKPDTIALFDLAPMLLQSVVVHDWPLRGEQTTISSTTTDDHETDNWLKLTG